MDATMLDGNAVAGLLEEIFGADMTTASGTCAGCGAAEPMGALHAFMGAGVVLRCPHCDSVLVKITRSETRIWMSMEGVRALAMPVREVPPGDPGP
ncbi:MAG: DUF6510 family protein [Thermoleophilia bacterium]